MASPIGESESCGRFLVGSENRRLGGRVFNQSRPSSRDMCNFGGYVATIKGEEVNKGTDSCTSLLYLLDSQTVFQPEKVDKYIQVVKG